MAGQAADSLDFYLVGHDEFSPVASKVRKELQETAKQGDAVGKAMGSAGGKFQAANDNVRKILPSTTELRTSFGGLASQATNLNNALSSMGGPAAEVTGRLSTMSGLLSSTGVAAIAMGVGIAGVAAIMATSYAEAARYNKSLNELQTSLSVTKNAAGLTASQIEAFATSFSQSTLTTKTEVLEAASVLARYKAVSGDAFKESISLAKDLSVALGSDLRGAIDTLGEVLSSPERGLTELEKFVPDDAVVDRIRELGKMGDLEGAQKAILSALKSSVGGLAEGQMEGAVASTHRLSEAWSGLKVQIAETLGLEGKMSGFTDLMTRMARGATYMVREGLSGGYSTADDPMQRNIENASMRVAELTAKLKEAERIGGATIFEGNMVSTRDLAIELRAAMATYDDFVRTAETSEKRLAQAASDEKVSRYAEKVRTVLEEVQNAYTEITESAGAKITREAAEQTRQLNGLRDAILAESAAGYEQEVALVDKAIEAVDALANAKRTAASIQIGNFSAGLQAELEQTKRLADAAAVSLDALGRAQIDVAVAKTVASAPEGSDKKAIEATARSLENEKKRLQDNIKLRNDEAAAAKKTASAKKTSSSAGVDENATREKTIQGIRDQIDATNRLIAAYGSGEQAGRSMERTLAAEAAARSLGEKATEAQRQAVYELTLEQENLRQTLEDTKRVQSTLKGIAEQAADYEKLADAYSKSAEAGAAMNRQLEIEREIRSQTNGLSEEAAATIEKEIRARERLAEVAKAEETKAGLRSEATDMEKQIAAYTKGNRKEVDALNRELELQNRIKYETAGLSADIAAGVEKEIRANAGLEDQLAKVQASYELKQQLAADVGDALVDAFSQAAFEGKNLEDVLKNLAMTLSKIGLNTFFTPIANNLMGGLMGGIGGGGGFNLGGLLGGFGGGGTSYFPPAPKLGLFEKGGPVEAGMPIVVGEKRAEVFVPRTAGTMLPNAMEALKGMGGRQGVNITNNFHGVKPQEVSQRSLAQVGARVGQAVNYGSKIR